MAIKILEKLNDKEILEVKKYLKNNKKKEEYNYHYNYNEVLGFIGNNKFVLIYKKENLIAIGCMEKFFEKDLFWILFCYKDQNISFILNEIKNYSKEALIFGDSYLECGESKLFRFQAYSSFNKEKYYVFDCLNIYMFYPEYSEVLVKQIEHIIFPEIDLQNLTFTNITSEYFKKIFSKKITNLNILNWSEICSHHSFAGFHYLHIENDYPKNNSYQYLLCFSGDVLIGAIKHGIFEYGKKEQVCYFIDVNEKYRNMGIATKMIQNLNPYLDFSLPLNITMESEMGKKCNISNLFEKNITSVPVIRSKF